MEPPLTDNALRVLRARYLRGEETPERLFRRVAGAVAHGEVRFGGEAAARLWAERYFELLSQLDFLPNSPTLMNAGTELGQLSACFVLPIEDSMRGIFDSLGLMALVQQSGGGTGFSFSRLRAKGERVASSEGAASGPVSFMRIFDCATENIRQGGRRRGANMGVLRVDHPDIVEFIDAKLDGTSFRNFNLSVGVTDEFMGAVDAGSRFALRDPRSGTPASSVSAGGLFDRVARAAWQTGDPGLLFLDAINRAHPLPAPPAVEATNPCGEVPLLPYEACNLGSLNLSRFVSAGGVDWSRLEATTELAVRFLDDVIEVGRFPDPRIAQAVHDNRKVGLGVMGFAELLIRLGIPYGSERALGLASELMSFVAASARRASQLLSRERGTFPSWARSVHAQRGLPLRNATLTSIAPTGTIGIIAGTSPGIEPLFGLAYRREHVLGSVVLVELNPLFVSFARARGFYTDGLEHQLLERGNLGAVSGVPADAVELFQTALELPPEAHLRVQAAFQASVDNAVSKTVNLPEGSTPGEVARIYHRAWELGLKGITVYRYGSRGQQVLTLGAGESPPAREHFTHCDPEACRV